MKAQQTVREGLLRALLLVGLGISLFLLREYISQAEMLCGAGGGCDEVRASAFANLLGVPTPTFGVLFFGVSFILSLLPSQQKKFLYWSLCGALAALGFIALQLFVVKAICTYCMIADSSALLVALLSYKREPSKSTWPTIAAPLPVAALALWLVLPQATEQTTEQPEELLASTIPAPIADAQQPGKVTILQFIELGCDACLASEMNLNSLIERYDTSKINVVRKVVPGATQYAQAKAICCASQLGLDARMIDEISASASFSSLELEAIAAKFDADPIAYRDCFDNWGDELVKKDTNDAKLLGVQRLPSVWVNAEQLRDNFTPEEFQSCLERAFSAL